METVEDLTRATSQAYNTRFMVYWIVGTLLLLFGIMVVASIRASRRHSMAAPKIPYIVFFLFGIFLLVLAVFWTLCGPA